MQMKTKVKTNLENQKKNGQQFIMERQMDNWTLKNQKKGDNSS
jgi:hypothetical protein